MRDSEIERKFIEIENRISKLESLFNLNDVKVERKGFPIPKTMDVGKIETTFVESQQEVKEEVKTLSNLTSGDTKQGGIKSQDDTNLQIERSDSLPVDNQPLVDTIKKPRGRKPKNATTM